MENVGDEGKEYVAGIVLSWVWRRFEELPVNIRKILVIDEAWLFRRKWAGLMIEEIARMGRKRNVLLIIATQAIEDIVEYGGPLKAVLQNSATKFIFSHDRSSGDALLSLQIPENLVKEIVTSLEPGYCLLMTEDTLVWVYWYPSPEEASLYSTSPR